MWIEGAAPVDDPTELEWLLPRFTGTHRQLTMHVPDGYPAHCRILHRPDPQGGPDRPPLRWAEIAAHTGAIIHPGVQWHRLIGSATTDNDAGTRCGDLYAEWNGYSPSIGQLDTTQFHIVADILTQHTDTADDVFFGFWEGNGRINVNDGTFFPKVDPPRFRLGGREQIVVRGDLSAVSRVRPVPWPNPNAMWPADQSWYLATEVDFDSTIIAGDQNLVHNLLAHTELEALQAPLDLDLTCYGDTIN